MTPIIMNSIKFYLLWAFIHYMSTNLYQYYCAERTFMGFIASSINTQMPHCKALIWLQGISIKTLDSYWILLASYVVTKVTEIMRGVK